jgi:hypothetical protein
LELEIQSLEEFVNYFFFNESADLPSGWDWPENFDFICQINLEDKNLKDLFSFQSFPQKKGILYFFNLENTQLGEVYEQDNHLVLYCEETSNLQQYPAKKQKKNIQLEEFYFTFFEGILSPNVSRINTFSNVGGNRNQGIPFDNYIRYRDVVSNMFPFRPIEFPNESSDEDDDSEDEELDETICLLKLTGFFTTYTFEMKKSKFLKMDFSKIY